MRYELHVDIFNLQETPCIPLFHSSRPSQCHRDVSLAAYKTTSFFGSGRLISSNTHTPVKIMTHTTNNLVTIPDTQTTYPFKILHPVIHFGYNSMFAD